MILRFNGSRYFPFTQDSKCMSKIRFLARCGIPSLFSIPESVLLLLVDCDRTKMRMMSSKSPSKYWFSGKSDGPMKQQKKPFLVEYLTHLPVVLVNAVSIIYHTLKSCRHFYCIKWKDEDIRRSADIFPFLELASVGT